MPAEDHHGPAHLLVLHGRAVVEEDVLLEDVAMSAHRLGLLAEQQAHSRVLDDAVVAEHVVGVLVADRDARALVAADLVVLEEPVLYAPADEQAVAAVVQGTIAAQRRASRAAAGVQPQRRTL